MKSKKTLAWKRGWAFFRQAWDMMLTDGDLIKPSVYALFVGAGVSLVALALVGGLMWAVGQAECSGYLLVVLVAVVAFFEYLVAYIFSAMTAYLIYGYLAEGDGRMDRAWNIVRRDFFDLAALAGVSALLAALRQAFSGQQKQKGKRLPRFSSGLLGALWEETAALLLPIMVIDDLPLTEALRRLGQVVEDNLLLVSVSAVGVRSLTRLISFLAYGLGAAAGAAAVWFLVSVTGGAATGWWLGVLSGLALLALIVALATVFTTYIRTAYYTCLYLWAREVEQARRARRPAGTALAPRPLAAALEVT